MWESSGLVLAETYTDFVLHLLTELDVAILTLYIIASQSNSRICMIFVHSGWLDSQDCHHITLAWLPISCSLAVNLSKAGVLWISNVVYFVQQFLKYLSTSHCRFDLGPFTDKGDRIGKRVWFIGSCVELVSDVCYKMCRWCKVVFCYW